MNICLIGGTGSLGQVLLKELFNLGYNVTVLARDEHKISQIKRQYYHGQVKFIIGDIRNRDSIDLSGISIVIHLAALKHVFTGQEYISETIKTNINGTENVIWACNKYKVKKLIYISSDKSVEPVNVYGMTKHIAEKLILNEKKLFTSIVRSGNIWNSRGSCIPYFMERKRQGKKIHLTDERMERYFIECKRLARFIIVVMRKNKDKTLYIPKMKSLKIIDIIKKLHCDFEVIGKRDGEKLQEKLFWDNEKYIMF